MDAHCFLSPSSTNTDETRAHSAVEKLGKIHAIGVYSTLYIFIKGWFDYQVAKHACLSSEVESCRTSYLQHCCSFFNLRTTWTLIM